MICFANEATKPQVRQMWKDCFGDSDEFLNIHFSFKYKNENTLLYFDQGKPVASLQMLPYTITFYGETIPFYYLAGLCTLPLYRKRGYMDQLIHESHNVMKERNIPLSILIPAEQSLFGFYQKYGYEQVFEKDDKTIPLKQILNTHPDIESAYTAFDSLYRQKDFCVQKNFFDFKAIVADYIAGGYPDKTNLSAMARIIDPLFLLSLYSQKNFSEKFFINLTDYKTTYLISEGSASLSDNPHANIEIDIRELCRLLFGYKTTELTPTVQQYFYQHRPIINLMLE